ncbi:MAG: DNA polymerase I [Chlamydiota bacterium]
MKNLYILDGVAFLFRSYFAIGEMTDRTGRSTNALYGFIRSIQKIRKDFSPDALAVVFDGPNNKQRRTVIYERYKSNRTEMPEDLFPQLEWAHDFCKASGIPHLTEEGVEADDLIGAITKWAEKKGIKVFICSSDKDLCQLISDRVFMIDPHKNNLLIDRAKVEEIHGVKPEQIVDYLAIMGDQSDNIPGIPGFGPKTAATLLKEYGSLEHLLASLDDMQNRKKAAKIRAHMEDALLSKKLATLILDIPYPREENFYHIKPPDIEALNALYREMNFNTLLKELGQERVLRPQEETLSYHIVDSESELRSLVETLVQKPAVCIDTETDRLSPMAARLVGVGLCITPQQAWYIPTNGSLGLNKVLRILKPLVESPRTAFYGHNIKYDIHILKNHGIRLRNIGFDTMIASHLLTPQNNRHGLDTVALERFGKIKLPIKALIGAAKKERSMLDVPIEKVGPYCCEDVDYTCRLKDLFEKEIENENLAEVFYKIELPLISILVDMERYGIYLRKEKLETMSDVLRGKLNVLEQEIHDLAGKPFNIRSPKQLGEILFGKLQLNPAGKKKSTRADVLESLKESHPIAGKILDYRALEKLCSTYTEALPLQVNEETGRIHCSFMQTVTATGRLSCKDPNLQNIPVRSEEGKKIREAFVPKLPGWVYLSADYSQIELRLLAHLSQDPKLIGAFNKGEDIHASTAATVFDVPIEAVTEQMRAGAKAVNFGIIYGQQAYSLSQELGIEMKEASDFIRKYFNRYPGVRDFIENSKEKVRKTGVATTMFGRKRPIPEINSPNGMIRAAAERLAVNTPLQGSQADIVKKAMIALQEALKEGCPAHMVLQIHDELIFELPEENLSKTREIVQTIMESITTLSVPLLVNIAVGKNWGEC